MGSSEFARLWAEHRVRAWDLAEYTMNHPLVGAMSVLQHLVPVPAITAVRLVVVTASRESSSQAALQLLAHFAHAAELPDAAVSADSRIIER